MPNTIVLVEDDALIRHSLADILEWEGFKVETAADGQIGLEIIRRLNGDCVAIIDLQMPVMTGEQLIDALEKEGPPYCQMRLIAITAQGGKLPKLRVPVLKKPLELDQLISLLKSAE